MRTPSRTTPRAAAMTVVHVGDGACTVFDSGAELMLLDCGVRRGSRWDAARTLHNQIRGREGDIEALVISHFDDDHWTGLQALPSLDSRSAASGDPVDVYYPYVPVLSEHLWAATMALISTRTGVGVKALNLASAWQAAGRPVRLHPLTAEDKFRAGGQRWRVAWPPRDVPRTLAAAYSAIEQLGALAADLAREGIPQLRDSLRDAYATGLLGSATSDDPIDEKLSSDTDDGTLDAAIRQTPSSSDEDSSDGWVSDGWAIEGAPLQSRPTIRNVARAIARANNQLSLVLEATNGSVVAFGDCEYPALPLAVRRLRHRRYATMLAPHHGTHARDNDLLPPATVCIAQQGAGHHRQFWRHTGAHSGSSCASTQTVGTASL